MTPTLVATSFTEFLEKEFVCSARDPYDVMTKQARAKLGDLGVNTHLIYVPSPLRGGVEDIGTVCEMNARAAMICNGDIATQLDNGPADQAIRGVQAYQDELHRQRIRLEWS
jgi:hypothetical protein